MTETRLLGLRVLVVEDEPLVAMLIEDLLTDLGCTVIGPANRLEDALQLVDQSVIDVAVLDVNLNGVESYPIANELIRRGVPFLFSSGNGSHGLRKEYNHYPSLPKPFEEKDLAGALALALMPARS